MIEKDTIKLLRECDAGVKMGVASIDDVLEHVRSTEFKEMLLEAKHKHEELSLEIDALLKEYHDDGKEPSPIAKGMSWIKTSMKLGMNDSDKTVAGLMTDGCDMGVKSLSRYLNQYAAADERSKDICKKLIAIEEKMNEDMRGYL
ncbi:MAG: hypothetical protein IJF73_01295 [Clostridia bacterium]|nr:hypothetical protein [Clostridia bacterium]MBR7095143.1 hypothetical protein [Clostridia bacterium]